MVDCAKLKSGGRLSILANLLRFVAVVAVVSKNNAPSSVLPLVVGFLVLNF